MFWHAIQLLITVGIYSAQAPVPIGFVVHENYECSGRNEIFAGYSTDLDDCAAKCSQADLCVSFEFWPSGHPLHGTNLCQVSQTCTDQVMASSATGANLYTKACLWTVHPLMYSGGWAGGVQTQFASIVEAKQKCFELQQSTCKAITCTGLCTVRASSSLAPSSFAETTYVPNAVCFDQAIGLSANSMGQNYLYYNTTLPTTMCGNTLTLVASLQEADLGNHFLILSETDPTINDLGGSTRKWHAVFVRRNGSVRWNDASGSWGTEEGVTSTNAVPLDIPLTFSLSVNAQRVSVSVNGFSSSFSFRLPFQTMYLMLWPSTNWTVASMQEEANVCTSTSTSTSPTTTTSDSENTTTATYSLDSGLVEFTITMNSTKLVDFLKEPEAETVIQDFMAELVAVNASWIRDLKIIRLRRLASQTFLGGVSTESSKSRDLASDFNMITDSDVRIEFDVVVPPDGGPSKLTANFIMEEFDKKSIQEATDIVNDIVKSGALGSKDYYVMILVKKSKFVRERPITNAQSSDDEEFPIVFFAIAAAGGSICLLMALLFVIWRLRKINMKREKNIIEEKQMLNEILSDESGFLSEEHLLYPPASIHAATKQILLEHLAGIVDDTAPMVFVIFARTCLDEDAGAGARGLFFAAAVVQALTRHGISCYTPLVTGDDVLCNKFPIKLLLLVEHQEIYSCRNCLQQLHCAKTNGIDITRLQFEEWQRVPKKEDQWPNICFDEIGLLEMREVVRSVLLTTRLVPDFPDYVQSVPGCLEGFVLDLDRRFTCKLDAPNWQNESRTPLEGVEPEISSNSGGISKAMKSLHKHESGKRAGSKRKKETSTRDRSLPKAQTGNTSPRRKEMDTRLKNLPIKAQSDHEPLRKKEADTRDRGLQKYQSDDTALRRKEKHRRDRSLPTDHSEHDRRKKEKPIGKAVNSEPVGTWYTKER